jgi:hypothetical protein
MADQFLGNGWRLAMKLVMTFQQTLYWVCIDRNKNVQKRIVSVSLGPAPFCFFRFSISRVINVCDEVPVRVSNVKKVESEWVLAKKIHAKTRACAVSI